MTIYDYDSNILNFTRKDNWRYSLKLRGSITVVNGLSGTGKSLLVSEISSLKKLDSAFSGVNVSNINCGVDNIIDDKLLYIIDRADLVLDDNLCDIIRGCNLARFLIFLRVPKNLYISPNHVADMVVDYDSKSITLHFSYNVRNWC